MSAVYVTLNRRRVIILVSATLADALAAFAEHGDTIERWALGDLDSGHRVATFQVWDEWTDDNFERVFDAMGLPDMPNFPTIRT